MGSVPGWAWGVLGIVVLVAGVACLVWLVAHKDPAPPDPKIADEEADKAKKAAADAWAAEAKAREARDAEAAAKVKGLDDWAKRVEAEGPGAFLDGRAPLPVPPDSGKGGGG